MAEDRIFGGGQCLAFEADAWTLAVDGFKIRAELPELHGTWGRDGCNAWSTRLSLGSAQRKAQSVDVPGIGALPGFSISGHVDLAAEAFSVDWQFNLALSEEGLLLNLSLGFDLGSTTDIRFGGVSLAPLEVCSAPEPAEITCTCKDIYRFLLGRGDPNRRSAEHSSFLVNGWQSFGFSGILHGAVPQPRPPLSYFSGAFHVGASLPPHLKSKDILTSDLFGLCWLRSLGGVLAGFLAQEHAFGGLALHCTMKPLRLLIFEEHGCVLQARQRVSSDWALVRLLPRSPSADDASRVALRGLQRYVATMALHHSLPACKPQPIGWCSWYCHGPSVSEQLMQESLAAIAKNQADGTLPFNLFQVDDGWQSAWGDWLTPKKERFPNGLQPLVQATKAAGLVAGLWLAPAAVVAGCKLMVEHPDWILRDRWGRPLKCGWTAPGHWMHALDTSHPEVLSHVHKVIHTIVHEWGFTYLKCDFLHCAAMPCERRYDPSVSRTQALVKLLSEIRQAAGKSTYLLACGAPLGPCVSYVDAIRVSADTAEHWLPKLDVPFTRWLIERDETNLPAGRNMVRSTLARLPLHRTLWNNDPDCLILRDDVPLLEAYSRATVAALSGGSLIFSDSLDTITADRLSILKVLVPPLPHTAQHIDLLSRSAIPPLVVMDLQPTPEAAEMGPWHLAAFFHWTNGSDTLSTELPLSSLQSDDGNCEATDWHVFDFWSSSYSRCRGSISVEGLPARCCRLYAVRPVRSDRPQLVGSNIHISSGLEIGRWVTVLAPERAVDLTVNPVRNVSSASLWVYLPGSSAQGCNPPELRCQDASIDKLSPVASEVWQLTLPELRANSAVPFRISW